METVTISQITHNLKKLPAEKLIEVYDFVAFILERERNRAVLREAGQSYALDTMLASEAVLSRDWDTPEEDEAWANL